MDFDKVHATLAALESHGVEYVVFGAAALNLWGLARFTEDLDIFIAPTEENVAKLRRALRDVFDDPHIDEITAEDLLNDYPAVQYVPPEGIFSIDILTRLGELFAYEDLEAERLPFGDIEVNVATPSTLYRMKSKTIRPQDQADAHALRRHFDIEDEVE